MKEYFIELDDGRFLYGISGELPEEIMKGSVRVPADVIPNRKTFPIGSYVKFLDVGWTIISEGSCTQCMLGDTPSCKKYDCVFTNKIACNPVSPLKISPLSEKVPEEGTKHDKGKIRPGLIPPNVIEAIAEVLTYGAEKYSPDNWKQVEPERYNDALWRHYIAWKKGEEKDSESNLFHAAHFATNALFLLYFELVKKENKKDENNTD